MAVFFGVSLFMQNKKTEKIVPIIIKPEFEFIGTTTIPVATTTKPTVTQTFPKLVTLTLSNSYTFPNGAILKAKELKSDSRCASDVQCIWAGNVIVKFTINNKEFELTHGPGNTKTSYIYNGYTIWFENVKPERGNQTKTITPGEYQFIMKIEKK